MRNLEILEKEFKKYHIPPKEPTIEKYMQQMTKKFNQTTVEDLIATIGYGGIMPSHVVPKIRDLYEKEVKKVQKESKELGVLTILIQSLLGPLEFEEVSISTILPF